MNRCLSSILLDLMKFMRSGIFTTQTLSQQSEREPSAVKDTDSRINLLDCEDNSRWLVVKSRFGCRFGRLSAGQRTPWCPPGGVGEMAMEGEVWASLLELLPEPG